MSIGEYIKINKLWLLSSIATLIIINCILFSSLSINKSLEDILYMDILIIVIQIGAIIYGFTKHKKKYESILKYGEVKEYIADYERDFYIDMLLKVSRNQSKKFLEKEEDYKKRINELQEYITQWVHDIKVNIAVCDLLLEEIEGESSNKLCSQIEQIKFRVNQVLYVTRANHYNKDIAAEEVDICEELKSAIRDNALFFMNKNIEINTKLKPFRFISDKKWIHYIFSQILNNSSKYTPEEGKLNIYTKEDDKAYYVYIKDSGIGIPKEDINRIFDKGFTGRNGRLGTKSTGMGLYYAKKMAEALSIGIAVKSEEGLYTEFIIIFYKLSDYYNITSMSQ